MAKSPPGHQSLPEVMGCDKGVLGFGDRPGTSWWASAPARLPCLSMCLYIIEMYKCNYRGWVGGSRR